jgi:hypothetical protein
MNEIEQKLWCDALLLAIGMMEFKPDKATEFATNAVKAFRRANQDLLPSMEWQRAALSPRGL